MGVTSLEVNNTVYNITPINKLQLLLTKEQIDELGSDTQLVTIIINLYETYDLENLLRIYR